MARRKKTKQRETGNPRPKTGNRTPGTSKPEQPKDPSTAALISVVGMLFIGAPALGYFYLDDVRKGVIYLAAAYLMPVAAIILYYAGMMTIVGIVCCLPLLILPFLLDVLIVWDVYLQAKGEPTKLPDFS